MKRTFLGFLILLAVELTASEARAGGGHGGGGGGWHGGGGYCHGYYGGHGCYGGYYGGHGCYGGSYWPYFSFGIGFGGCYPGYYGYYGYPAYSYPAYSYAYAPAVYAQPTYAYRAAQPYSATASVAVAATPSARPALTRTVYVHPQPATTPAVQKAYYPASPRPAGVPATAPTPVLVPSQPATGTWVMDRNPYRYTPTASGPNGSESYVVIR